MADEKGKHLPRTRTRIFSDKPKSSKARELASLKHGEQVERQREKTKKGETKDADKGRKVIFTRTNDGRPVEKGN